MTRKLCAYALLATAMINGSSHADVVDPAAREQAIHAIARLLADRYAYPELGERMAKSLQAAIARKDYATLTEGSALAERLTRDLREICHDKHLRVMYSPEPLRRDSHPGNSAPGDDGDFREEQRRDNGGVDKVEVLPGNIGYLHLNYFGIASVAGPRLAGAMSFLSGTDALIVDIRNNGGAIDPGTIAILCSYFFPEERVHLNSLLWREGNREEQSWTLPLLPGPRYLDRPVFVLTSGRTFSGAEEFAYNLQTRRRATIVGAQTGGGANPGGDQPVSEHFAVWVPMGHALNPVTKTNWEGVGVTPEVPVKAATALLAAQKLALEKLIAGDSGDSRWKEQLRGRLAQVQGELSRPAEKVTFVLPGSASAKEACVVGSFNDWEVGADKLKPGAKGWSATLEVPPGPHSYKFWVDGEWYLDPANAKTEVTGSGFTNSVLHTRVMN